MLMIKTAVVFGTRPEAIKMANLCRLLRQDDAFDVSIVVTGQHREMLDQVLEQFDIWPDIDLQAMEPGQSLPSLTSKILIGMHSAYQQLQPDLVLVHGDTTTSFAAALAASYQKIPVGHIEAGLRTGNIYAPWPEELNRRFNAVISQFHFAPTEAARKNLLDEGVDDRNITVTGNTVIDTLMAASEMVDNQKSFQFNSSARISFGNDKRLILVTGHRRENFDEGLANVCSALRQLADRDDVEIVYSVHPNPNVKKQVYDALAGITNITLLDPLSYFDFVYLMKRSYIIITDSGGIQEEAPALGIPVLVTRDVTERPEAVEAGCARIVGASDKKLMLALNALLDNSSEYRKMAIAKNPYGDGQASGRIIAFIKNKMKV